MSKSSTKNIVVVGGGITGVAVAQQLSAKANPTTHHVILVEAKTKLTWLIAGCRMTVVDDVGFVDTVTFAYDRVFEKTPGTVKHGEMVEILPSKSGQGGEIVLKDGEKIPYDALVLTLGSLWPGPLTFPTEEKTFKQHVEGWRAKFKAAKDITLIGGGAVGLEFAGELRDQYPNKQITVVHGEPLLLNPAYPEKYRKRVQKQWEARGIKFTLGDFVDSFPESGSGEIVFQSGKKMSSDLVVFATGPKPNTNVIASSLGEDTLNAKKFVKVTPTLQLPSHSSIFAAGDIIDWPEQKQAAKAGAQEPIVTANVLNYVNGKPSSNEYKGSAEMILITNGKAGGAGYVDYLWGIMLGNKIASILKSKTLMVSTIKPRMGY